MCIAPTSPAACALRAIDRIGQGGELAIVICIDVEPDPRTLSDGEAGPWRGFERFGERVPAMRERLQALTGRPVAFSWFLRMDPQIEQVWGSAGWAHDAYEETLAGLIAEGDELALHTHAWRWDSDLRDWVADFADADWAEHCVSSGLDAFEAAFGGPCASHRGGDGFLSAAMIRVLAARGVRADFTVEPGRPPDPLPPGEHHRGPLPDHRGAPARPFRSTPTRFPEEDRANGGGPLFIPHLTSPALVRLRPVHASSRNFAARLAVGLLLHRPRVLAIAVRTEAALKSWNTIAANLEHLARHRSARFLTASAAAENVSALRR